MMVIIAATRVRSVMLGVVFVALRGLEIVPLVIIRGPRSMVIPMAVIVIRRAIVRSLTSDVRRRRKVIAQAFRIIWLTVGIVRIINKERVFWLALTVTKLGLTLLGC